MRWTTSGFALIVILAAPLALRAQAIAKSTNEVGVDVNGPVIGNGSCYGGSGVHAPN